MNGSMSFDQYMAENLQDPEYAAVHAINRPLGNLSLNVWSLRETKGMTQKQLAEAAQMKQPRVADIERDASNPTLLTISRIAFALGVTADRLLAEPDESVMASARAIAEARAATWGPGRRRAYGLDDVDSQEPAAPARRRKTA
jgi:transcriptional regulator with XRE-family HTH domain